MEEVEKWKLVNGCQTKKELLDAVDTICDGSIIIGNTGKPYDADKIKRSIMAVMSNKAFANVVTRAYGIRQQVLYLMHYGEE